MRCDETAQRYLDSKRINPYPPGDGRLAGASGRLI
jgi:hypothetical protein